MRLKNCRSCQSTKLVKVFNLGLQKLSGIFPKSANQKKVPSGKLSMVYCNNCCLLQLEDSFNPSVMYGIESTKTNHVAIIGTEATIRYKAYSSCITRHNKNINFYDFNLSIFSL